MICGLMTVLVQIHLWARTVGGGIGGAGRAIMGSSTGGRVKVGARTTETADSVPVVPLDKRFPTTWTSGEENIWPETPELITETGDE